MSASRLVIHTPAQGNRWSAEKAKSQGLPIAATCGVVWIPKFVGGEIPKGTPRCRDCRAISRGNFKPHYVYRYYDEAGLLLYVGCTRNPIERDNQHRRSSHWYGEVASVRRTVFPSRAYALRVEKSAIQTEDPAHNRALRVAS